MINYIPYHKYLKKMRSPFGLRIYNISSYIANFSINIILLLIFKYFKLFLDSPPLNKIFMIITYHSYVIVIL